MPNGLDSAPVLKRQGGDNGRVPGRWFSSGPDLRSIDENLGDPAIIEPADPTGVALAVALQTI